MIFFTSASPLNISAFTSQRQPITIAAADPYNHPAPDAAPLDPQAADPNDVGTNARGGGPGPGNSFS